MLGWRPTLGLDTALEWIVEWHRAHSAGADMRETTLKQIERFGAATGIAQ
jgi:CDP-glucose 4,6-dehydratase